MITYNLTTKDNVTTQKLSNLGEMLFKNESSWGRIRRVTLLPFVAYHYMFKR